MSKTFKRVALVAATALLAGSFSAVSASAAPSAAYTTMYDTTNGIQTVGGQATVTASNDTTTATTLIAVSGVGSVISGTASGSGASLTGTPTSGSFQLNGDGSHQASVAIVLFSAVAGTTTVTMTPLAANGTAGTAVTKTVTWVAAATLDATQSTSKAYLASGTSNGSADPTSTVYVDKGQSGAAAANVVIIVNDGNGNPISGKAVTATVSGPGLIKATSGTTANTGTLRADSANTDAAGKVTVGITADGTNGVSTITVTAGAVTFSKSVTFTGAPATYAATSAYTVFPVASNGTDGSSSAYGIKVKVTDSAGNLVADNKNVFAKSSDTSIATVSSGAQTTVSGYVYFQVVGVAKGSATISFCDTSACSSATVTTTAAVTVGSSTVAKVTLSLDDSSYVPGQAATLTVTAVDSAGSPVADGTYSTLFTSAGVTSSLALTGAGTLPGASVALVGGKKTYSINMPLAAGTVSISGTDTTSAANTVSVSAAISGSSEAAIDAANEATDAANAATDAANAAAEAADAATAAAQDAQAAVAALATQVASLIAGIKAQITTLTNLVIKIQKKVKA